MKTEYTEWISNWLKSNEAYGACAEATLEMQTAFPELIRVRGHFHDAIWGERQHWWLKTKEEEIVDPTASQFPTKGVFGEYEEWEEGREEPIGKCMNCGDYVFASTGKGDCACSEHCYNEIMLDFNKEFYEYRH